MSFFSDTINTLTQLGLTGPNLIAAVTCISNNSPTAAVRAACSIILANAANPTVVKDEVTKIAEIPNLPSSVMALLPELAAAQSPSQVVAIVQAIETSVGSTGFLGF